MLKRVCTLGVIVCLFIVASCSSKNNSSNNAETGAALDSMVDQATSAVKNTTDSVRQSVNAAADSTKAKFDSAANR